ncbi:MAG: SpoIIE family protein phosphatase [Gemmataceae bacterium]|nr:SpoIIE family protein phosphatase [Gemmataceae bacterium]
MEGTTPALPRRGIGFHAAVAVNVVLFAGVAGFLAFDAARETRQREREKLAALDEEAMTLHQAVAHLAHHSPDEIQAFVDGVCGRMTDAASPGHHIVAEAGGRAYQARAHGRDSDDTARAVRAAARAPDRRGGLQGEAVVVGTHTEGGVRVFVAERLDTLRREVRAQVALRAAGVLAFGLVLAAAVNLTVYRLVTRPLRRLVRTLGAIRAGELGAQAGAYNSRELAVLAAAVNDMSRALAADGARRRAAIAHARRVQENLLPKPGRAVPGVTIAAVHRPAEGVAGDYYDAVPLADGSVLVCVADVVGHGVPAAMVAAVLKVLVLDAADRDPDPGRVVRRVNARLTALGIPDGFASLLVARWCPEQRTVWYASAGHEPGLLSVGSAPPVPLDATGILLGVVDDGEWESHAVPAGPGATLVLPTDGVTEAMDADGVQFGRSRLREVVAAVGGADPERVVGAVDAAVRTHLAGRPPDDDYTLVAVRFLTRASFGRS